MKDLMPFDKEFHVLTLNPAAVPHFIGITHWNHFFLYPNLALLDLNSFKSFLAVSEFQ